MDEKLKASEAVFILARTWMFMALGALALYFVLLAIEQRPQLLVHLKMKPSSDYHTHTGYHVPVEPEEVPLPVGEET